MAAFAAHFHRPCPSRCGASQPARYRPTQPSGHCIDETRHHERSRIHQRRDAGDSPPRWDEPGKDGREIRLWHAVLAKRTCRVCDLQPGSDKRMLVAQARERFSLARVASVMHHHSAASPLQRSYAKGDHSERAEHPSRIRTRAGPSAAQQAGAVRGAYRRWPSAVAKRSAAEGLVGQRVGQWHRLVR